ncbi:uncharacterized protein LOC106667071 [Cimex lectularius]|uniref:C2H2-type domain-containing protein n=1 Tax=Cimex lectularius TaxID=79782 RepID=A0A8I6RYE9_CIMLE|nr:uncharacterized protein LOC106667071 [Cimex lectularius]
MIERDDENNMMYFCEECCKTFRHKKSLVRHKNNLHNDNTKDRFTCAECFKDFGYKCNLVGHIKKLHASNSKPFVFTEANCALCGEYGSKKYIVDHYKADHDINLDVQVVHFDTDDEFYAWKANIESIEMCLFVKERTLYTTKDGTSKMSFKCFRDGKFKRRGKNIRNVKYMGSNKLDGHCPAKIDYSCTDRKISVTYCRTHVGHERELARLPLTKEERKALAEKIAQNVSFDSILNDIRESVSNENFERIHLLTKKDLFNIAQQYNLKSPKVSTKTKNKEDWSELKLGDEKKAFTPEIETQPELVEISSNDYQELIIYETITTEDQPDLFVKYEDHRSPETVLPSLDERKVILLEKLSDVVNRVQTHEELDILFQLYDSAITSVQSSQPINEYRE